MEHHHKNAKWSAAGLLVALGIIYGDIGTSPLYVMQAIFGGDHHEVISETLVMGAISCIFWTLTFQTTLKYVLLVLRADNRGEGGIFALYALVRRHKAILTVPAIIGGATLLADGIITPPISVMSAVEGLTVLNPSLPIVPIVIVIITLLFLAQILGTSAIGKAFGPVMLLWFSMLAFFGLLWILKDPSILKALSPVYGYRMLVLYPGGFWLLGAVFLCTTGAEALYSDLGHCGRGNIRVSWIFVKICLILQYMGQGVWLMQHLGQDLSGRKPFFELMPNWFIIPGVIIATSAAIIASQALITGSFTLISEGIRLNFWPKVRLRYPSNQKGQIYVPSVNILLWLGCILVVLYFQSSSKMEAAYGLAITLTMLMTTGLFGFYLYAKKFNKIAFLAFMIVFFAIEGAFLVANLVKFMHGGYVSLIMAVAIMSVMVIWYFSSKIKMRLTEYVDLKPHVHNLKTLSADESMGKYATHLIFMTNSGRVNDIEQKIIYSIFEKRPKRADIYWFVHVDVTDDPYTKKYKVDMVAPDDVYRITFKLGFRVEQKINLYFRKVLEDLLKNNEVHIHSRYDSLTNKEIIGDLRFVVLERFLSYENELPFFERLIMQAYFFIKQFTNSEVKWFGLDHDNVKIEKVPLLLKPAGNINLERIT
jgi:KUP system potassium uptake protein